MNNKEIPINTEPYVFPAKCGIPSPYILGEMIEFTISAYGRIEGDLEQIQRALCGLRGVLVHSPQIVTIALMVRLQLAEETAKESTE